MKTFPKKFKLNIFGLTVSVETTNKLMEKGVSGLYMAQESKILVDTGQFKGDAVQTLLHEIGHSVIDRTGIRQTLSDELEEVIVDNIATAITENFTLSLKKN